MRRRQAGPLGQRRLRDAGAGRVYFFTDATVIIDPTAEQLAAIALNAAELAKLFDVEPRIAMLSFSNFGSTPHVRQERVRLATETRQGAAP